MALSVGSPLAETSPKPVTKRKRRSRCCVVTSVVLATVFLAIVGVFVFGFKTYTKEGKKAPQTPAGENPSAPPSLDKTNAPISAPPETSPASPPTGTNSPTPEPTSTRIVTPTSQPFLTVKPTVATPTGPNPTWSPLEWQTDPPSPKPTASPTPDPTTTPTPNPTATPTHHPTATPTNSPTISTISPTVYSTNTVFYAVADVPYTVNQARALEEQMQTLPKDGEFLVHLGDIKKKFAKCTKQEFQETAKILLKSPVPVFITVGDNEYNDCSHPDEALKIWRQVFHHFDRNWSHNFNVTRQAGRHENFAFVSRNTLFIGLNIVGSNVHDKKEWEERLADELHWTIDLLEKHTRGNAPEASGVVIFGHANPSANHKTFFTPLKAYIQDVMGNRVPMLYMGGDVHKWLYEPNFFSLESFLRIRLSGGVSDQPLRMNVDPTEFSVPTEAFRFDRKWDPVYA